MSFPQLSSFEQIHSHLLTILAYQVKIVDRYVQKLFVLLVDDKPIIVALDQFATISDTFNSG